MTAPNQLRLTRGSALAEIRSSYPPLLTTAQVAELMQCTVGEVRDQIHRGELPSVRWGQQFRFFRDEVLAVLLKRSTRAGSESDPAREESEDE